MASSCIVPVVELENVRKHPNADKLDLADVLGYQVAIAKDKYKSGDKTVYFPADTLIPSDWAEKFNVKNFLRGKDNDRVGRIKLRGEPSFGLVVDLPDGMDCNVGDNVADYFGATKYEPPIRPMQGDQAPYDSDIDPYFDKYTDIENGRIYTEVFQEGEQVVATEKIHGTNCRVGIVRGIELGGSMEVRRKRPETDEEMARSTYWFPWSILSVKQMLQMHYLAIGGNKDIVLYGEIYGGSVQNLHYGVPKGTGFGFRAFDLQIEGKYVDYDEFVSLCDQYGVERVPEVFKGEFDLNKIKGVADGSTLLEDSHMREGVVVKPLKERTDPKVGRAVLKYIGTEYSLANHSDFKDV